MPPGGGEVNGVAPDGPATEAAAAAAAAAFFPMESDMAAAPADAEMIAGPAEAMEATEAGGIDPEEFRQLQAAIAEADARENETILKKVGFAAPGNYWGPSTTDAIALAPFVPEVLTAVASTGLRRTCRKAAMPSALTSPVGAEIFAPAGVWKGMVAHAVQDDGSNGFPLDDAEWTPGTVLKVSDTAALFHYAGLSSESDRWIPLERAAALIRLRGNLSSLPPSIGPEAEDGTHCICKSVFPEGTATLACDDCDRWYHMECVGVTKNLVNSWSRTDVRYQCPMCASPFGMATRSPKGSKPAGSDPKKRPMDTAALDGKRKKKREEGAASAPRPKARAKAALKLPLPKGVTPSEICRACAFGAHSAHSCGVRGYSGNEALQVTGNPPSRAPSVAALPIEARPIVPSVIKTPPSRPPVKTAPPAKGPPKAKHHSGKAPQSLAGSMTQSMNGQFGEAASADPGKGKPGRQKKRMTCDYCPKTFLSESQLKFHMQEHVEMSEENALCEKMLKAGRGPDRGLNQANANRKLVLVATPLAVRYGAGYPFQVKQQETWVEIKKLIEKIPEGRGADTSPKRVPFVYTNVKPEEGGEEGRAYQLNETALQQVLANQHVRDLLSAAAGGGLGRMGVDYKIDSIHHLHQTHSSWFERHIDKHASGSLDFAIICMVGVDKLEGDSEEATGCGIELFPWAQVHDESLNLVQGGNIGNSIVLKIERPGDCAVFPGRWLYHRSVHSDLVNIHSILHKVVFFGYFLQSVVVPVAPLI